jgi:hypothetical protein
VAKTKLLAYKRRVSPADDWVASAYMVSNPLIEVDDGTASGRWHYVWCYENDAGEIGWGPGRDDGAYRKSGGWLADLGHDHHPPDQPRLGLRVSRLSRSPPGPSATGSA